MMMRLKSLHLKNTVINEFLYYFKGRILRPRNTDNTMQDDYDFSQGIRGKFQHFVGQPQTVRIRQPDGTVTETVIEPAIELDADVRKYFLLSYVRSG